MRHLALIAMLLLAGSVSAAQCTNLHDGKTMSYWANQGNGNAVGTLIDGGCDVNSTSRVKPDGSLLTPLQAAIITDNSLGANVASLLIHEKNADPDAKGSIGRTPLMLAAEHNRISLVRMLMLTKASIDATDSNSGKTALLFAKSREVFTYLVSSGANIQATTSGGLTPLHVAAQHVNDGFLVDLLFKRGVKAKLDAFAETTYSTQWSGRESPLMLAAAQSQSSDFLRRLISRGAKIEASYSNNQRTAIHYAARWGNIANVKRLIDAGADVNAGRDAPGGISPIFAAVEGAGSIERTQVVKALIAAGGKVTDAAGNKPSIPDSHQNATALKAIIDNPKPYWPVRAYALGIRFNSTPILNTRSSLYIGCHETNGSCLVYFDCTDNKGAKTGNATLSAGAMVRYWDKPSNRRAITIAGQLGLGAGEGWSGMLDCALRSQQNITAQVWSRTNTTLTNNTGYIRSDENNEVILQKTHPKDASSLRMAVRIRCIGETDCKNTIVKCRSAAGTTASNMSITVGKIDRQKTAALFNYARGSAVSDFPAGIESCTLRSEGEFLVQMLTSNYSQLINHTGVSKE